MKSSLKEIVNCLLRRALNDLLRHRSEEDCVRQSASNQAGDWQVQPHPHRPSRTRRRHHILLLDARPHAGEYRVTIQVDLNLPLTSKVKQQIRFSMWPM